MKIVSTIALGLLIACVSVAIAWIIKDSPSNREHKN
jgi:hypothetical protein